MKVQIPHDLALRHFLILGLLLTAWLGVINSAKGQSENIIWSGAVNVSNTIAASAHPAIVADEYGYVHLFWSEEVGGELMRGEEHTYNTGNTIFYKRWDGAFWTTSIDILFSPGEDIAEFPAVTIDKKNRLHLVWIGTTHLYYSNVQSWQANSVHAWHTPVILAHNIGTIPWGGNITADESGNLHVIYAAGGDDDAGIYYRRSVNGGETWESVVRLSGLLHFPEESFSTVKIVSDASDCLHAVWETNQSQGYGQAIYYARSTDQGNSWSQAIQLGYRDPEDYETAWPYLQPIGITELHLIYVDGPGSTGRFQRTSTNNGETWSEPIHILPDMVGVNGYMAPLVDSTGQIHLIINMRPTDTQVVGIYYAHWIGDNWSPVKPVDLSSSALSAHYTTATVRLGNELHVVYTQLEGGEIWHLRGFIPAANQITSLPLPTPKETTPVPELSPVDRSTPAPTSSPALQRPKSPPPTQSSTDPTLWLMSSVGASLILVISVIVWTRLRT